MVDANENIEAQKELNQPEAQKTSENSENSTQNQSVTQDNTSNAEAKQEKMIPQSEVDRLIYAKKMEERERITRDNSAKANANKDLEATVDRNDPGKVLIDKSELAKIVNETAATQAEDQRVQQMCYEFANKIQATAESKKYADFETTVAKLNLNTLPQSVVEMTNALDNTGEVLYELAKNPSKYSSVLNLSNISPQLAYDELIRLSGSIKKNQDEIAVQEKNKVNEPLDQVKPSRTGTGDGKLSSVSDYRKHPDLRG